jgi:hypothetical protein
MLRNYLLIAVRNLKKIKFFLLLIFLALALGMAAVLDFIMGVG